MQFRLLTQHEVEAVMAYAKALHNGEVEKPEDIDDIGEELATAIRQAAIFKATLRETDYGLVMQVFRLMLEKDTAWVEAATEYQSRTTIH